MEMCGLAVSSKAGVHGPKVKVGDGVLWPVVPEPQCVASGLREAAWELRVSSGVVRESREAV